MSDAQTAYPWYEIVKDGSLAQGDLLNDFEVLVPRANDSGSADEFPAEFRAFDFVVMTQSCDIQQGKVESILLCPRWGLWDFVESASAYGANWGKDQREALRRGNLPGYHLLNEGAADGETVGLSVVDFHEAHTAPTKLVLDHAACTEKRLRLRPPYREHLAQAFARFFMRVGLPVDIAPEKLRAKPA